MSGTPGGLYLERLDFDLEWVTDSPMHIGAASFRHLDGNQVQEIVAASAGGRPHIPATTLKGALRSLCGREDAELLFGTPGEGEGKEGHIGHVLLGAALMTDGLDRFRGSQERPEWRTSVDPRTGAAKGGHLFGFDRVPAGSRFQGRCRVLLPKAKKDQIEEKLAQLLASLHKNPLFLGRNTSDGQGRVELSQDLEKGIKVKRLAYEDGQIVRQPCETWPQKPPTPQILRKPAKTWTFHLQCDGPYLSKDPYESRPDSNDIMALREEDGTAKLLPSSLSGALRQRAAWNHRLAGGQADQPDEPLRQRWLAANKNEEIDLDKFIHAKLTPVERLFGVSGLRARLSIEDIKGEGRDTISMTSVALDRFSMAPIQGALFTFKAILNPGFTVRMSVDSRPHDAGFKEIIESDIAFVQALLDELRHDELLLGHGTSKGFGWFKLTWTRT